MNKTLIALLPTLAVILSAAWLLSLRLSPAPIVQQVTAHDTVRIEVRSPSSCPNVTTQSVTESYTMTHADLKDEFAPHWWSKLVGHEWVIQRAADSLAVLRASGLLVSVEGSPRDESMRITLRWPAP